MDQVEAPNAERSNPTGFGSRATSAPLSGSPEFASTIVPIISPGGVLSDVFSCALAGVGAYAQTIDTSAIASQRYL
jgi:hypothetical protein